MRASGAMSRFLDTLLPSACVVCSRGVPGELAVCALCRARFPHLPRPRCGRCSEPAARPVESSPEGPGTGVCEGCMDWPEALHLVAVEFAFHGPAALALKALKFGRWRGAAPPIAAAMLPSLDVLLNLVERPERPVLVPVPLAAARLRERGFNQSALLAGALARARDLEVADLLVRYPGGDRQARVGRSGRTGNVSGRFGIRADRTHVPAPDRHVIGEAAILVDDVLTTGATLGTCAVRLAEAGFSRVAAVTFARTLRPLEGGS